MSIPASTRPGLSTERRGSGRRESDIRHEHLTRLLGFIKEGILGINRDWIVTYANDEAFRRSRIVPEDVHNKTFWEIYPHNIGTELDRTLRRSMETGESAEMEYFSKPLKVWIYIQICATEEGLACFYQDITDRKSAEMVRDASARQLEQVLEATTDAVVSINRNWEMTFLNRRAAELLRAKGQLVGKSVSEQFSVADLSPEYGFYAERAMHEGIAGQFEAFYPEPLNLWLSVQMRPSDDGIVIFFSDITERRRADEAIRQQHELLAAVQSAALVCTWEIDLITRKVTFGPGSYPVSGHPLNEIPDLESFLRTVYPPHIPLIEQAIEQTVETGEMVVQDVQVISPEGRRVWVENRARAMKVNGVATLLRGTSIDITARRHADAAVVQQQELLSVVQQASRVATWEVDYITGKVTFGVGSYPVFGHPLETIPHFGAFKKICVPEYLPVIAQCLQSAIETGEMIVQEFQVWDAEGKRIWLESRGQAVMVDGVPTSMRGITIDISARKKIEEERVASEARYRVLAELNPQGIWMGAPDGTVTYLNQSLFDYTGLTPEGIDGTGWLEAFYPGDRPRVLETWQRCVATGTDYDIEARLVRAGDGLPRWWWIRAQPVRDEAGRILHWLGVAIDIDDRKTFADTLQKRQEETERQRAELETIYQTAPIGLALFDPVEFRYLRVNDRQAETIGLPRDKILGRCITEIAPIKGIKELFQQAASGHPVRNRLLEGELPARPGEHRSWNVSYSPVYNVDGTVEAIAAAVLEMTNQKKAEAALIQSEKLAAVGRLASSISHEINNPLEAITNLLYLINLDGTLPDGVKEYVHTAQAELSRVCQIATQTLRFHRQAVRATYVTAAELVGAVLTLYQGRLMNSGITVEARYSTSTRILCFENDIRQVLNNLIANAIDAMRQGGRLLVRAHDATEVSLDYPEGRMGIRITIADTGLGMSPAVRARIFEPFYTTKDLNGTGLGLWISAGIVGRHQGRLSFRSTEHPIHHGTIFTLFLPWAEVPTSYSDPV